MSLSILFCSSIFGCHAQSGDQPQEDLAKFGYKTNIVEKLGILLYFGDLLEPTI
jgi:hypothetical protein